jgi:mono/diheme cytochrome c family protein
VVVALASACGSEHRRTTTRESLFHEAMKDVPKWANEQGFTDDRRALAGARLFAASGCLSCHTYLGTGSANLGAPDLTSVGRRHDIGYFKAYVPHPDRFGNLTMPRFDFGPRPLTNLAIFLEASKGRRE